MTLGRLRLSVAGARDLAEGALRGIGYHNEEARIIADHVIDAAMCGYEYSRLAKILRPLLWFGLLEHRSEKLPSSRFGEHHFYRKMELFDRLLAFDVHVDLSEGARH